MNVNIFVVVLAFHGNVDASNSSKYDQKSLIARSTNQVTTPIGGNGGSWFNDCSADRDEIVQINVRAGRLIDNIQVTYGDEMADSHGSNGGTLNKCILNPNEKITAVRGRYGRVIDQIEFVTNEGKVCGPYGGSGGRAFSKSIPGYHLSCIFGRSGRSVDQIAFVWQKD